MQVSALESTTVPKDKTADAMAKAYHSLSIRPYVEESSNLPSPGSSCRLRTHDCYARGRSTSCTSDPVLGRLCHTALLRQNTDINQRSLVVRALCSASQNCTVRNDRPQRVTSRIATDSRREGKAMPRYCARSRTESQGSRERRRDSGE